MSHTATEEVTAAAARLVVEEGQEYGEAKRRAARSLGRHGARLALPSDEQLEDEVRSQLALFHADTQPDELRALRRLALPWLERLAEFRPHLGGAVWRGTATRMSSIRIDLYCDDSKSAEIALLNLGVAFDVATQTRPGQPPLDVLTTAVPCPAFSEPVTIHLIVRDRDEQRGALKPDARGRTWRGDAAALRALLAPAVQVGAC